VRTYQLRRYKITAGEMSGFTAWLNSTLIPVSLFGASPSPAMKLNF
jgi:hypothetical protein